MVVGEALSSLIDAEEKQVNFKVDELKSSEALWYKSLVAFQDSIGMIDPLKSAISITPGKEKQSITQPATELKTPREKSSKIVSIEELDDDYEDEGDDIEDLTPYAKPDSDAEDSDEDPTLITRNRPTVPVYIRDLITYLRDTESYDRQKLGLTSAPSLIRRKASFGTEVTAHTTELATILVGLQDKYDIPNFQDLRLQSMIAVILSSPKTMAPWFSKTFFDGDYSLSQRASILTVLSVSARELGGYGEQDKQLTTVAMPASMFPSKQLPPKMHAIYAAEQETKTIDALSSSLSQAMIAPMAASAADSATGPNILKVRTFSSRLAVESRRKPPTTNALSSLVATSYFFPLTARFSAHMRAFGAGNVVFSPMLLSSFIKTLSLILHASGPYVAELEGMTSEYWDLLLSVRPQAHNDKTVAEALMIGLLTILEVNGERDMRSLVERHGRELTETQSWVDLYFQNLAGGTGEDGKVRSLAAAVLVRISEVVQKYQALLVGNMGGM